MLNVDNTQVVKYPHPWLMVQIGSYLVRVYYVSDALFGAKDAPVELKDAILTVT